MNRIVIAIAALVCAVNIALAITPTELFHLHDEDGNGQLDIQELTVVFNHYDRNNDTVVPYPEFLETWQTLGRGDDGETRNFFRGLDRNGDGVIDQANDRVGFDFFDRDPRNGLITESEFTSRFPPARSN